MYPILVILSLALLVFGLYIAIERPIKYQLLGLAFVIASIILFTFFMVAPLATVTVDYSNVAQTFPLKQMNLSNGINGHFHMFIIGSGSISENLSYQFEDLDPASGGYRPEKLRSLPTTYGYTAVHFYDTAGDPYVIKYGCKYSIPYSEYVFPEIGQPVCQVQFHLASASQVMSIDTTLP